MWLSTDCVDAGKGKLGVEGIVCGMDVDGAWAYEKQEVSGRPAHVL